VRCARFRKRLGWAGPILSVAKSVFPQSRFTKRNEAEFMQYRSPVGIGPSSNT
jgi:hypothetical protein